MKSFDQLFRKPPVAPKSHLSFFPKLSKEVTLNSGKGFLGCSVKLKTRSVLH